MPTEAGSRAQARLAALCVDAYAPAVLAGFWGDLLGWPAASGPGGDVVLLPSDDTGFQIRFVRGGEPTGDLNSIHLHLTSTSHEDQQQVVTRSLELGARHLDLGQRPGEGHVVLADPEGNEFCVIESGNGFLAGCGFLAELACDGTQEAGYFWSAALGWPLVWDQDQETSIRSPHGGPKVSWGGPPLMPRSGRNRLRFDLAPPVAGDLQATVDRLTSLGATRLADANGGVLMTDPDGDEFRVLPAGPATALTQT